MSTPAIHGGDPALRVVHASARIGSGVFLWNFVNILADVVIGNHCSIGTFTEIGRGSTIGDCTRIGAHVFLPPNSTIGRNVFIGPGVVCTDDRHPVVSMASAHYKAEPPTIGDFASIGAAAVILPGVKIGAGARIGAGAVVTRDVPPDGFVRGEPAREREPSASAKQHWVGST